MKNKYDEMNEYISMKLFKILKPIIIILLVLMLSYVLMIEHSRNYPKDCIVIGKKHYTGLVTGSINLKIYIYPRYKIRVTNGIYFREISIDSASYQSVKRFHPYKTKHELYKYQ